MIRDEYELLALHDAMVADQWINEIIETSRELEADFDPRGQRITEAAMNLTLFVMKYRNRMDDVRTISEKIDQARTVHSKLKAEHQEVRKDLAQTTQQLEDLQSQYLELMSKNEELKKKISVAFS
jgi:chromosome segregation ATPase